MLTQITDSRSKALKIMEQLRVTGMMQYNSTQNRVTGEVTQIYIYRSDLEACSHEHALLLDGWFLASSEGYIPIYKDFRDLDFTKSMIVPIRYYKKLMRER